MELVKAKMIDNLCQRYSCLPSELLREDVSMLKRLGIVAEGAEDNE